MKKAFTPIEVIIGIIILGIISVVAVPAKMMEILFAVIILGMLAAVSIPRLNKTREDAILTKASANIKTLVQDVQSYHNLHNDDKVDITKMSNVGLRKENNIYYFDVEKEDSCLSVEQKEESLKIKAKKVDGKKDKLCKEFLQSQNAKAILGNLLCENTCKEEKSVEINTSANKITW